MLGYKKIFDDCSRKTDVDYDEFRSSQRFYFVCNNEIESVSKYLTIAHDTNADLYKKYLLIEKPTKGYKNSDFVVFDNLDAQHLMLSTWVFDKITIKNKTVIEIGGGFGNFFRINQWQPFNQWIIYDLPFVQELQKWYLSDILTDRLKYAKAYTETTTIDVVDNVQLALVVHSLSEFDIDTFINYLPILTKCNYILYVKNNEYPCKQLLNIKDAFLLEFCSVVDTLTYDNGHVTAVLYKTNLVD